MQLYACYDSMLYIFKHGCTYTHQAGLKVAKAYQAVGGITRMFGIHLPGANGMAWVDEAEKKVSAQFVVMFRVPEYAPS